MFTLIFTLRFNHCRKELNMQTTTQNTISETKESHDLREGLSELKGDASAVRDDLNVLKEDATKLTAHATQNAIEAVKSGTESAGEMAKSFGENAKKCHGSLCEQVSARPTTAVILALGAGVIAGRLLARK
tara:strand:- start:189 stop:581 length:393 start_codon:yes stop_codon:yes gene_type:complete